MSRGRIVRLCATAVLASAALLMLLAAGCGGSGNPFAGTWHDPDGGTVAVIAPNGAGYRVTVYGRTLRNAEREGDRLHAWTDLRMPDGELTGLRLEAVFTEDPGGGLVFTDPAGPGVRIELTRASDATVIPSPWPTGGAQ